MIKSKTGLLKIKKGHLYIILLNYTFQWYSNNSDLLRGGGVKKKLLFLLTINIIKMEICWLFRYNLNSVILEMIWNL